MVSKEFKRDYRTPEGLSLDNLRDPETNEATFSTETPPYETVDPKKADKANQRMLSRW